MTKECFLYETFVLEKSGLIFFIGTWKELIRDRRQILLLITSEFNRIG